MLKQSLLDPPSRGQTAIERVIDGWRTDRGFTTPRGRPRRLQISTSRSSFSSLVRKYGGDVPHRAVLDELRRIGAVIEKHGVIQLRASRHLCHRDDSAFLTPVIPALTDALRIANGPASTASSAIRRLSLLAETETDAAIIRDRCASSAQSMLDGLSHSLGQSVSGRPKSKGPVQSFTVTVLIAENRGKRTRSAG